MGWREASTVVIGAREQDTGRSIGSCPQTIPLCENATPDKRQSAVSQTSENQSF